MIYNDGVNISAIIANMRLNTNKGKELFHLNAFEDDPRSPSDTTALIKSHHRVYFDSVSDFEVIDDTNW